MSRISCQPLVFLITGFTWLLLSLLVGCTILIGLVYGTPLPFWLKLVHVHAALIGGILQIMIGGLLASLAHNTQSDRKFSTAAWLFIFLNASTVALLVGFGLGNMRLVGFAGIIVAGVITFIIVLTWQPIREHLAEPTNPFWVYCLAFATLLGGLTIGSAMAFQFMPEYYAHARLLHLHLILLGFITILMIGITHRLLPIILHTPLHNPRLAQLLPALLFLGFFILISGFLTAFLYLQLIVGGLLAICITLYAYNLVRTWISSEQPGTAGSDYFLVATFFLVLTMILGLLVGANLLPQLPVVPFGSLHLVAYTHIALIGFIVQTILAGLSYGIPELLVKNRTASHKKQTPYRDQLVNIMTQKRAFQLITLSFGTMSLLGVAALTWNFSLNSLSVQIAAWVTVALLLSNLLVFAAKLIRVFMTHPIEHARSALE